YALLEQQYGQPGYSYQWSYDGTAISSSPSGGSHTPLASGTVCLDITDACGYVATDCMEVTVVLAPIVEFTADTLQQCWPADFELTNLTDPALFNNMTWTISDGTVAQNQESITVIFAEPGMYDVSLQVVNLLGCAYSHTEEMYLTSFNPPIAGFDPDPQPTDATDTEIFFENMTLGDIAEYEWEFGDNPQLGSSNVANPTFTFPIGVGGIYPVTLTVTDVNNCTDMVQGYVDINDIFQVYVPNTFTPNLDGINDVFFVEGADIDNSRFLLQIFNRWGDKVFETKDINTPWTGDIRSGEYYGNNEVYNWRAVVVSASTGEKVEMEGFVNLIR
ncbi:MAG: PKD domain-containing protein, partial [Flavobacteriales bacterium]